MNDPVRSTHDAPIHRPWRPAAMARVGARLCASLCAAALLLATVPAARAHGDASEASGLSLVPVAVSLAAPVSILATGAVLTVSAVEASGEGTVWVLERASDGARASVRLVGKSSVVAGTALTATAVAAGWVLSAAGVAVAIVPHAIGRALMHDERISQRPPERAIAGQPKT